ncbi:MAG: hypothetical protein IKW46_01710 [Bacteroidaceae bacterium]|nr:hypothetical protein [Bacteroidaceae bacterium]
MNTQAILIKNETEGVRINRSIVTMINELPSGKYRIVIEEQKQLCSVPQRKLMWMWFTFLERETGTSRTYWHDYFCKLFLDDDFISTKDLSSVQMAHFMNQIQAEVAVEWGYNLPLPEDKDAPERFNEFVREYQYR